MPPTPRLSRVLTFDSCKANLLAQAFPARVCRAMKSLLKVLTACQMRCLVLCMLKVSMAWSTGSLSRGFVLQNWLSGKACCWAMFSIFSMGSQTGFKKGNKCKKFDLRGRRLQDEDPLPLAKETQEMATG